MPEPWFLGGGPMGALAGVMLRDENFPPALGLGALLP